MIRSLIHVSKLKATLRSEFDMNNLGDAKWILKMVTARDRMKSELRYLKRFSYGGIVKIWYGSIKGSLNTYESSFQAESCYKNWAKSSGKVHGEYTIRFGA